MIRNKNIFLLYALSLFFFLSGACGLIYEIIWVRKLGLIFGNTTLAISTVLAVFMAGLGLGSLFFGRYIDRHKDPLRWYGWLEIGIGIFCLATPSIWAFVERGYVLVYQVLRPGFWQFSLIRFAVSFLVLFIPTFLMGGTLPVVTKFLVRDCRETAKTVGFLYGVNTFGACAGVLISSFFAIYYFGINQTVFIAAAVNIFIGLATFFILKLKRSWQGTGSIEEDVSEGPLPQAQADISPGRLPHAYLVKLLFFVFALSGFTSMTYQLCWTKVLALCLGSSVYSFAIMLATFLAGLSIGSFLLGWLARHIKIGYSLVGLAQILIALFVAWGVTMFDQLPFYFLHFFSLWKTNHFLFNLSKFLLSSLIILPPTILIGCMFAMVTHILNRSVATTGKTIGHAYLINTIGCILGSVFSGFILVPSMGIYRTLILMVVLNLIAGSLFVFVSSKGWRKRQVIATAGLIMAAVLVLLQARPWSKGLLTTNIAIDPKTYLGHSKYEILSSTAQNELLYYKEGLSGTVAVKRHHEVLSLAINANIDASNGTDMYTQLLLGHLPSLFTDKHDQALVIGMGSAVTVAALAAYPYKEIHCVELEQGVVEAAKFFAKENRDVLNDPRAKSIVNDGRNHLLVEDVLYDVIVSEPSSPWMAGVSNLFTVEQFRLIQKRLAPRGVVCQWLNTYSMSPENIQMIIKTFRSVFAHTSLWQTMGADLLLIGSDHEIVYDLQKIDQRIQANGLLQKDLRSFKVFNAAGLLSCFMLTSEELGRMSANALINTDNLPLLEYSAPLNLYGYEQVVSQNLQMINSYRISRYPQIMNGPRSAQEKVRFHNAIARAALEKGDLTTAAAEIALSNTEQALNPGSVLNYGIFQFHIGRIPEAIVNLENYISQVSDDPDAQFYLARAYMAQGEINKASMLYAKAASIAPDSYDYLIAYGQTLAQKGEIVKAVEVIQRAIDIKGLTLSNGLLLVNALFAARQMEKAIAMIEHMIGLYPHSFVGYEALARMFEATGALPEAVATYQRASRTIPFDARVYYALSILYEKINDKRSARIMAKLYRFYDNAPKIGGSSEARK